MSRAPQTDVTTGSVAPVCTEHRIALDLRSDPDLDTEMLAKDRLTWPVLIMLYAAFGCALSVAMESANLNLLNYLASAGLWVAAFCIMIPILFLLGHVAPTRNDCRRFACRAILAIFSSLVASAVAGLVAIIWWSDPGEFDLSGYIFAGQDTWLRAMPFPLISLVASLWLSSCNAFRRHQTSPVLVAAALTATTIELCIAAALAPLLYFCMAIMIALAVHWLTAARRATWIDRKFITPRHLKIAMRYLVAAGACLAALPLLVSLVVPAGVILGAGCLSLVLVSIAYCTGSNGFLAKREGGYSWRILCLYWPYLFGSLANYCYWRNRVDLMSEVYPGVWIGRRPRSEDWDAIRRQGICTVIDLVPELAVNPSAGIVYQHQPFLDVTIPDPKLLADVSLKISAATRNGGVLIFCALGMSRSVLAACAWLIDKGHSADEAAIIVGSARSTKLVNLYMVAALRLYLQLVSNRGAAKIEIHTRRSCQTPALTAAIPNPGHNLFG